MASSFSIKALILAKHGQHVVLVHFPIALFLTAVAFDVIAQRTKREGYANTSYYNLCAAALSVPLVLGTGIIAWLWQLEGQGLKGLLLLHLVVALISSVMILMSWWIHFRSRTRSKALPGYRLIIEMLGVAAVGVTGHLGGFLSGVNGPS